MSLRHLDMVCSRSSARDKDLITKHVKVIHSRYRNDPPMFGIGVPPPFRRPRQNLFYIIQLPYLTTSSRPQSSIDHFNLTRYLIKSPKRIYPTCPHHVKSSSPSSVYQFHPFSPEDPMLTPSRCRRCRSILPLPTPNPLKPPLPIP